jgi:hypothetical protein
MKQLPGLMLFIPGPSFQPGHLNSNPWKSYRNQERLSLYQVHMGLKKIHGPPPSSSPVQGFGQLGKLSTIEPHPNPKYIL